jgi:poly-gamma-glutamate capsule biosynthesis protein CapA/YwtB (metallophosphatase superfamily)
MNPLIMLYLLLLLPSVVAAEPVIINAVGDIMLAGSGERTFKARGYDYPFAATSGILQQGDFVIGNLESPIALSGAEFTKKRFRFKVNPKAALALKNAGFTNLSLANNHILDFGAEGLRQTLEILDSNDITHSGAGSDLLMARKAGTNFVKGLKIASLSYSLTFPEEFFAGAKRAGTAPGYSPLFTTDIKQAKKNADCVIVSFHWGEEGLDTPKPYQIAAAHKAVEAGADIVIGHHPHVLQGIEHYKNGVIFYSLGNFLFGSMSRSSDRSMIARITFDSGIKGVEIIPLNVLNSEVGFQSKPLSGIRAEKVARTVDSLSEPMGSRVTEVDGRYLVMKRD